MILGVSHIVLGTASLDRDAARLETLGFNQTFVEKNLETHLGKRPFMTRDSAHQSIAFFGAQVGPAIELIEYGNTLPPSDAPFQLVLPASLPDDAEKRAWNDAFASPFSEAGIAEPEAALLAGMASPLWFGGREPGAGTIVHIVDDVRVAREFWMTLGWVPPKGRAEAGLTSERSTWALLDFPSVLPQWRASMILMKGSSPAASSQLDGAGFRCLSFVTSDLNAGGELLRRAGAQSSTGRMDYVINGKALTLEIFAGPGGAMIELLEVRRGRS